MPTQPDTPGDRIFTKFVDETYVRSTTQGHLKFGTLVSYRLQEGRVEHRLSDTGEGTLLRGTTERPQNATFEVAGSTFTNCSFGEGGLYSIAISEEYNSYIFCASAGDYDEQLHRTILERNPSLTHYVTFNGQLFAAAVAALQAHLDPNKPTDWGSQLVRYGDRVGVESLSQLINDDPMNHFENAVFRKPAEFAHEKEVRFGMGSLPASRTQPIFTRDMPNEIIRKFARAAIRSGSLNLTNRT